MLVKVQNLGTLQTAETDLSKDLIVFCGGNNSGKTYMLNFLYGILKDQSINFDENTLQLDKFLEQKTVQFTIQEILAAYKKKKLEILPKFIGVEELPNLFDFQIENDSVSFNEQLLTKFLEALGIHFNDWLNVEITPNKVLQIDLKNKQLYFDKSILIWRLSYLVLYSASIELSNILQFFTAERQSCLLFSHQIFADAFDSVFDSKIKFVYNNSYPEALLDELRFVNNFVKYRERKSDFEYLAVELENLIGGKISSTQDGALKYKQSQSKAQLNMVAVSSTIKSLASFIFYFRHVAQKGACVIIDEPELSLHPDNQRKFARFLARCVNEGFKVIISTHSDYIISEINNLITLHNHKDTARTKAIMKKYGYKENQTIDYQRVGAYLFKEQKNELIPMTKQGFSVETIDNEIDNLADASDDIANNFDNLEF